MLPSPVPAPRCVPSTCPRVTAALCEAPRPAGRVTMAGLYIFLLGLVLPQFLMAFARREQCVHPGDPAAVRRMRALRGEGLAGGWGLMPAGGSVCPSQVLGAASWSPVTLLPGTSESALAPSSPCPPWGSWGLLRDDLAQLALVGAAQPEPSQPFLAEPTSIPCPAQGSHTGLAPACRCCSVTGEPRMGPGPQGDLPTAAVRGRLPPLIPLTALLPVQSSTGC